MLYQKHRPTNVDEMVGNKKEFEKFMANFDKPGDQHSHAYLIYGATGCGKTTLARMACSALKANVIEINSAQNRGIDTIREITATMNLPALADVKIAYIIDEVHRTTKDFQEGMLKPLEDCPKHIYFFLCTTEPNSLLETVKNRCQKVEISPLEDIALTELVKAIAKKEGYKITDDTVSAIVENSMGSARNALTTLEKVLGEDEDSALDLINKEGESDNVISLCRSLLKLDWKGCQKILKDFKEDAEKSRRVILSYMAKVAITSGNPNALRALYIFRNNNTYDSGIPGLVSLCHEVCDDE